MLIHNDELDGILDDIGDNYLQSAYPYSPYSGYPVWAAAWQTPDDIYYGANYEEVAFNGTIHGEQAAIVHLLNSEAHESNHKIVNGVWVRTRNGGTPCGHCRQFISEFAASLDIPIVTENFEGERQFYTLRSLVPHAFTELD